jgi:hypothetical protein
MREEGKGFKPSLQHWLQLGITLAYEVLRTVDQVPYL